MQNIEESNRSAPETISTENELLRAYVSSLIGTTGTIDKFTSWLLAGIGAISSIIVANINSISSIISTTSIKASLYLLAMAFIFGLIQKILSLWLSIDIDEESKLRESLKDLGERGHGVIISKTEGLTKKVIDRFRELHPRINKKLMSKNKDDIDGPLKRRVHIYYWQYFWVGLSLGSFLLFMLVLIINIRTT
jgi:hypothetical protein